MLINEKGSVATEYALVAFLVAAAIAVAVAIFGESVAGLYGHVVERWPGP